MVSIHFTGLPIKMRNSGAPYPKRKLKETHEVIMASGIAGGLVRTTTATTVESRKMAAILRLTEACSLGFPCTFLIYDILL